MISSRAQKNTRLLHEAQLKSVEETREHAVEMEKEEDAPQEKSRKEAQIILTAFHPWYQCGQGWSERLIFCLPMLHSVAIVVPKSLGAWCNQVAQRAPVTRMIGNGSAEDRGRLVCDE